MEKRVEAASRRCGWPLSGLVLLAALALPVLAQPHPSSWQRTVTHVSDGDTLWVRPQRGGAPQSVRIDAVDAPELCQAYGETARAALAGRVVGQTVQIHVRRHNHYGRALARVSLHGQDIGRWLVSQGHAWAYRYRGRATTYARLEAQARRQRLGLFRMARAEPPYEFRRRHGSCH